MRQLRLLTALLLLSSVVLAQTRQLSGTVKDSKSASALPSVTIKVKGKNIQTTSNSDGAFSFDVPTGNISLELSSVSYGFKTVDVSGSDNNLSIEMDAAAAQLEEVFVTALGISKESKKLGYSVTKVSGETMNKARETNIALSLSGQVAGLNVHGTSGGPGGSARIMLRGLPSMTAGTPLFVINGVQMDNSQRGSAGEWGGSDNGDGIQNINPDDIESISVLKGQAASALYGARASNGVILITTKSGKKGSPAVEYNMNYSIDKAIDYSDFQYAYGQGIYGAKPATATEAQTYARMSWGAKLDGSSVIQFDGNSYPYSAVKDNLTSFYRSGPSFTNTVSLSGGGDRGTYRLSLSNLDNKSIVRNSGLTRKTINLNLSQKVTDRLSVNFVANYIDQFDKNKPYLSDGPLNVNNGQFLATNIDQAILAPGYNATTGAEVVFSDDIYVSNPWFVVNQLVNNITRKRLITSLSTKFDITSWLSLQGRLGYDLGNDRYFSVTPWGTAYSSNLHGGLNNLSKGQLSLLNGDVFLAMSKKLTSDINLDGVIGGNILKREYESVGVNGGPFVIPYQYSFNNVVSFGRSYDYNKSESHSAYYSFDFGYKNFLNLSTTGRYDEFSTVYNSAIPKGERGIFTPSVSAGFIFSELINIPKLNYGKLRVSYAQTSGEPATPYSTAISYSIGNTLNGMSTASFSTTLPNQFLKPFTTTEHEIGLELKLLNSRLGIDLAYYTKKSKNEIMSGSLSSAAGYTANYVATGSTQNNGLEALVTGTLIKNKMFTWNASFNFTTLKNKILETNASGGTITLGTYRPLNATTAFVKGMAGPQIRAYDYSYDSKDEIIVDASGLPVRGNLIEMGSVLPKVYGGLNNEFSFKDFTLSFLIDYNYGNKILSASNFYAIRRGLHSMTLEGRETGVTTGVTSTGSANTVAAKAQDYYMTLAQNVSRVNVLDGDYIKLRQLTLGYNISDKLFGSIPLIRSVSVSLVARNLAVLMKKTDNIDPEAGFSSLINYAGIEGTSLPSTRTIGVNVNIKFK